MVKLEIPEKFPDIKDLSPELQTLYQSLTDGAESASEATLVKTPTLVALLLFVEQISRQAENSIKEKETLETFKAQVESNILKLLADYSYLIKAIALIGARESRREKDYAIFTTLELAYDFREQLIHFGGKPLDCTPF